MGAKPRYRMMHHNAGTVCIGACTRSRAGFPLMYLLELPWLELMYTCYSMLEGSGSTKLQGFVQAER